MFATTSYQQSEVRVVRDTSLPLSVLLRGSVRGCYFVVGWLSVGSPNGGFGSTTAVTTQQLLILIHTEASAAAWADSYTIRSRRTLIG